MNYLPSKLNKLRKHYNYSQSYLAEVLGIETIEYMAFENGSKILNYSQMKKLASLYHINVYEIFRNDERVTLYEINGVNTDEVNIEYFTRKRTVLDSIKDFVMSHKVATCIIGVLVILVIVLSSFLSNMSKPVELKKDNTKRLSVSETTVLYIDDNGNVAGSGTNTNGELSNLSGKDPVKVAEGEGFSLVLNKDGSVYSFGLIDKYAKEVSSLKNIVDIEAGASHILALDSSDRVYCISDKHNDACEIENTKNIKKIFATANGSIVMDELGQLTYAGTFIGSSNLKNYYNVKDIASSENLLCILTDENSIIVVSKNGSNFLIAESWNDIVDVACGDSFVAGLDSFGKVHIEIDNDEIIETIENWSGIIAIDAGSDYLIGFDGKKIYGVGNNYHNQFVKEENNKQTLEKVSNVTYTIDRDGVSVQFKGVPNASGYIVNIDVGIGLSKHIDREEVVKFDSSEMIDGKSYTISITSVGEGDYRNSDVYSKSFTYIKPEDLITIDPSVYLNRPVNDLLKYLNDYGVSSSRITGIQSSEDDICGGSIVTVSSTNIDGMTLTRSELLDMDIEYTYCRIDKNEEQSLED